MEIKRVNLGEKRPTPIVRIKNLSKSYGKNEVLKNVSVDLMKGHIIGLLGPNGCGKTSLLKIISGLINDYSGTVLVNGRKPDEVTKSMVAYLPERTYLPEWMKPKDAIKYFADFYKDFDSKKAYKMAETFQLPLDQKIKTMSKGQQEKLQLILVMSRNAILYLLDEPLGGVDPASRSFILDVIMKNYANNSTVLMSTHLIHDVEYAFDRVLMIGRGSVLVNSDTHTITDNGKTVEDLFKEVFQYAWEVN